MRIDQRQALDRKADEDVNYQRKQGDEQLAQKVSTIATTAITIITSYLITVLPKEQTNEQIVFGILFIIFVSIVVFLSSHSLMLCICKAGYRRHCQRKEYSVQLTGTEINRLIIEFETTASNSITTVEKRKKYCDVDRESKIVLSTLCYCSILDAIREMLSVTNRVLTHRNECINSENRVDGIDMHRITLLLQCCNETIEYIKEVENDVNLGELLKSTGNALEEVQKRIKDGE